MFTKHFSGVDLNSCSLGKMMFSRLGHNGHMIVAILTTSGLQTDTRVMSCNTSTTTHRRSLLRQTMAHCGTTMSQVSTTVGVCKTSGRQQTMVVIACSQTRLPKMMEARLLQLQWLQLISKKWKLYGLMKVLLMAATTQLLTTSKVQFTSIFWLLLRNMEP